MSGVAQGVSHTALCVLSSSSRQFHRAWTPPVPEPGWVGHARRRTSRAGSDLRLPVFRLLAGCSSCSTTRQACPAARRPPTRPRPRWSWPPATVPSLCQDSRRSWGWGPARCCHPTSSRRGSPRWPRQPSSWTPTSASARPRRPSPLPRPCSHTLPCCLLALTPWGCRRGTARWRT